MKNPFVFGEEVTGVHFCNRRDEITRLSNYMEASNKVLLYSPRRWGKTSLIKEVVSRLPRNKYIVVYADLYSVLREEHFSQIVARAFAHALSSPVQKALKIIRSLLSSFIPRITIDPMGETSFEFGFDSAKKGTALAEELLDAIARYAKDSKKAGVVILDEFQQIGELADDRLEKVLRSKIQSQRHVSYIFAGSKRHLLIDMFSNPSRPFYKSAIHFPLGQIPRKEMRQFVMEKFNGSKMPITAEVADDAITMAGDHPYHTQQLCFYVWEIAKKGRSITASLISEACERILSAENASYSNVWGMLTRPQKIAIKALAILKEGEAPFSLAFLQKVGLTSADAFRKSLESLVSKELVEKENGSYSISDVFMKKWLVRD